jgi:hypothetical protein
MELKDWLNSINFTKENLMEDLSNKKDYPPYIINRCMSAHVDCILYANEMNMHSHLSKDMQYAFYLNGIRKKKRFSPWIRKDKVNDIDAVKQYYGYSNEKASQALKVLNNTQLNFIKQRLEKGGQNGRSNC